jgi:hypothetical protein
MENRSVRKKRCTRIERISERSRLEQELLVAAYEFAYPTVHQRTGSSAKTKDRIVTTICHNQAAVGGQTA